VRVQSPVGSHEEREKRSISFLAEMTVSNSRKGVIIRAPQPPGVWIRAAPSGRFDRQCFVDKPT